MERIKELYNKLTIDLRSIASDEMKILLDDFMSRANSKIRIGNEGTYIIQKTCNEYIFNGILFYNPGEKAVLDFRLFIDKKITVRIQNETEVYLVNCRFEKKPVENSFEFKNEFDSNIDEVISRIERLNYLYKSGSLSDDEFLKLKADVINKYK